MPRKMPTQGLKIHCLLSPPYPVKAKVQGVPLGRASSQFSCNRAFEAASVGRMIVMLRGYSDHKPRRYMRGFRDLIRTVEESCGLCRVFRIMERNDTTCAPSSSLFSSTLDSHLQGLRVSPPCLTFDCTSSEPPSFSASAAALSSGPPTPSKSRAFVVLSVRASVSVVTVGKRVGRQRSESSVLSGGRVDVAALGDRNLTIVACSRRSRAISGS